MKLIQGAIYTVHGASTFIKVSKIQYIGDTYIKARIEFLSRSSFGVIERLNVKLFKDKITHWKRVN